MKRLAHLAVVGLALLFGSAGALAQSGPGGWVYTGWQSLGRLASAISVLDTSSTTALPAGGGLTVRICNTGATDAYIALVSSAGADTSATAGSLLKTGACIPMLRSPVTGIYYTHIAAITATSTTTLYVEVGNGNP